MEDQKNERKMEQEQKQEQNQKEEKGTSAEDAKTETEDKEIPNDFRGHPRWNEMVNQKNEYKEQMDYWKNRFEELKNDFEEMENPEEIKEKYKKKLEETKQHSLQKQKEFAVKEAALAEDVNKKALNDFVQVADIDNLEVDDEGNVVGVENLIAKMKEEKDYFFQKGSDNQTKTAGTFGNGNNDTGNDSNEDWAKKMADKFTL